SATLAGHPSADTRSCSSSSLLYSVRQLLPLGRSGSRRCVRLAQRPACGIVSAVTGKMSSGVVVEHDSSDHALVPVGVGLLSQATVCVVLILCHKPKLLFRA